MSKPSGQYIRIAGTAFSSAGFSVGDVVTIENSTNNDGIYTINAITSDATYQYLGLSGPTITAEDGSAIDISNISVGGNRLICLGHEDTGSISLWSYNDCSQNNINSATLADAPSIGTSGWSNGVAYPMLSGSNAKFIFTPGNSSIRICDINISNSSMIKHLSFIGRVNFANKSGGMYAGYYEHSNNLSRPSTGGYLNKNYDDHMAYGVDNASASDIKVDFHLRRSLGKVSSGAYSNSASSFSAISNRSIDSTDILATEDILYLEDAQDLAKVPIDSVIGMCNKPRLEVDGAATFKNSSGGKAEKMLVRSIDKNNYSMRVYRGYAGSGTSTIDWNGGYKYLVQYGCGFNFKVVQGDDDSGTYQKATYEFAQSFIYDGNQESLLRTPQDFSWSTSISNNRIGVTRDAVELQIQVYAFAPYNGRITGGRIYIRELDSNESWSLLVDIDIVKGCRTSIDGEFKGWTQALGTDVPTGCFHCGTNSIPLISKGLQLDKYADINNYYPEIKRNSIGLLGESYQSSAIGGERAWVGNLKLQNSTGSIDRFGDRVMYSEFGKYDVFPDLNWFTASKGDAEDIVSLEYFGDRLLIFKNFTLHIWNVASSEPFNWMPERTVKYGGVENNFSVTSTPYGVVWANRTGCYFYDGQQVVDLTENKIRSEHNSYHGSIPPSWSTFINSSTNLQKPMAIYLPKNKEVIIKKTPLGGSSTDAEECYIYNFSTRSWVFNTTLFTESYKYTNPIVDWNGNVTFAIDGYNERQSETYLSQDLETDGAYSKDEMISSQTNREFNVDIGQWVKYNPDSNTFTADPAVGSGELRFAGSEMGSTIDEKEGVELPVAQVGTIVVNQFYKITVRLKAATTMANVPFFLELGGASAPIGEIDTTWNYYSATIMVSSDSGNLRIYKMSNINSLTGTDDHGEVTVSVDNVSVKQAGIKINNPHPMSPGNYLKLNSEWFKILSVNPNSTLFVEVEGAQFSTTAANHSTASEVQWSAASLLMISHTPHTSVKSLFITKDIDFDQPGIVKKIYKIYITYKNTSSTGRSNIIKVATDGNTTWAQTNITSAQSINDSAGAAITPTLTGTFLGSTTKWDVATFSFSYPLQCQSIALYLNPTSVSTGLHINDITFEYKTINRRIS